jgi:hypothetical protein
MVSSTPTLSANVSPGLQEAAFRYALPLWTRRYWPGRNSTCLLAVGGPTDTHPADEAVLRRLGGVIPLRLAGYHREEMPRAGLLLGVAATDKATSTTGSIVLWGIGDNVAGRMGRLFRMERLEFAREGPQRQKGQQPGQSDRWRFVRAVGAPSDRLGELTLPAGGAQKVCRVPDYTDGLSIWHWRAPDELVLLVSHLRPQSSGGGTDWELRVTRPSTGATVRTRRIDPRLTEGLEFFSLAFSRFGRYASWLVMKESKGGEGGKGGRETYNLVAVTPDIPGAAGERVIERVLVGENPFESGWASDDAWVTMSREVEQRTRFVVYDIARPDSEPRTLYLGVQSMYGVLAWGWSAAGEMVLDTDTTARFQAVRLDGSEGRFREYPVTRPPGATRNEHPGYFSPRGGRAAWAVEPYPRPDPNFAAFVVWVGGSEGQGLRELARLWIADTYTRDTGDAPFLNLQWSPDERSLGFIRDGWFWRLPVDR